MKSAGTFWQDRTVLITGCSGFLGGWLWRRLYGEGARIIGFCRTEPVGFSQAGLDKARLSVVQGSLADYALLERIVGGAGVDFVFHLAAQSKVEYAQKYPRQTFETNIQGTWNLLEAVRTSGRPIRVVMASSDVAYWDASGPRPEASSGNLFPYAASKVCAQLLGECYYRTYGVSVSVASTSNLYGGGDLAFQRIVPGTIRAVIRGEEPVINSNGLAERDYLYVEDAVKGYLLLAEAMDRPDIQGKAFHFGSGVPITVLELVNTILKFMGRPDLKVKVLGEGANGRAARHLSSGAREDLGWFADSSLESGLMKTIDWYRSHTAEVRREAEN